MIKPAYAALAMQTRELLLINMWAGQLVCEGVSWLVKRAVKQDRPEGTHLTGLDLHIKRC